MAELAYEPVLPGDPALPPLSGNVVVLHADGPMVSAALAEAQALCDAGRYEEADAALTRVEPLPQGRPDLALRAMHVRSWMALADGRLDEALEGLQLARGLAEGDAFTDADRGEALFRLGACQYKRNANGAAVSLLTLALELFDRSGEPCDRLRAHTMVWRARCYQRQRDWESARTDVEHALVLADSLGDDQVSAHALFQASLVAERESQWLLARYYASEARQRYENLDDDLNVARLTNNLGGLSFLLGEPEEAALQLADSYRLATELGNEGEAARAFPRSLRFISAPATTTQPSCTRSRRSSCSTADPTSATSSGTSSSCWAGRCSSSPVSTRPTSGSGRPSRASPSSAPPATSQLPGWLRETWPAVAGTPRWPRRSTARPPSRSRTSISRLTISRR